MDFIYFKYWERKNILASKKPHFSTLKWWHSEDLCEVEQVILSKVESCNAILDVGAGDLRVKRKIQNAGFNGEYHTQDIGEEFVYTYKDLDQIDRTYSVILCLDVIEHLPVFQGLELIHTLSNLLVTNGVLIIQTPNARCIRNPLISDMTHLHCYNLSDLWAYLTCMNFDVEGFRVCFEPDKLKFPDNIISLISKYSITRFLGLDYSDNIIVFATKN